MLSVNGTDKLTYFPWKSGVLEHVTLGKRAQCGDSIAGPLRPNCVGSAHPRPSS